jgi:hypothetical protein
MRPMTKCDTCGECVPTEPNLITTGANALFECPWCETRTPIELSRLLSAASTVGG